jgi:hypothetical protein
MTRLRRHAITCGPVPVRNWGSVLGEGHVPDVVQAVLDRQLPPDEVGEPGGAGLGEGEAGDRGDDHGPPPPPAKVAGLAGDLADLRGVPEGEPADGDGLEGAEPDPAVRPVAGAVQDRDVGPWQADAGEHQDGDQWMPAPGAGPGVGDGGEVGQQVRSLGWSERSAWPRTSGPAGSRMMGRQARASTVVMRP